MEVVGKPSTLSVGRCMVYIPPFKKTSRPRAALLLVPQALKYRLESVDSESTFPRVFFSIAENSQDVSLVHGKIRRAALSKSKVRKVDNLI